MSTSFPEPTWLAGWSVSAVITSSPSDTCAISMEQLSMAYLNLLRAEMQLGTMRIPCTVSPYDSGANVRSHHGAWDINYSPTITVVTPMTSVKAIAEHFANCLMSNKRCTLLTFDFKRKVNEEDLPKIQEMAIEMVGVFNEYFIKEYAKRKTMPNINIATTGIL